MPRVEEGQDPHPRYPDPAGALRSPSEQAFTLQGSPSQKVPHTRASTTAWVTFRKVLLSGTSAQTNPPPGSRKAGHTEHRQSGSTPGGPTPEEGKQEPPCSPVFSAHSGGTRLPPSPQHHPTKPSDLLQGPRLLQGETYRERSPAVHHSLHNARPPAVLRRPGRAQHGILIMECGETHNGISVFPSVTMD